MSSVSEKLGYRDLEVWNKSMELAELVYPLTKLLPDSEKFGLCSQLCRCAVSIPSNIAEGYGRGEGNYRRHILIARGSLAELETQIELCVRLSLLSRDHAVPAWKLAQEIGRMLTALASKLKPV
ncbi:four helix bundle protein [Lacunimicrobium album]